MKWSPLIPYEFLHRCCVISPPPPPVVFQVQHEFLEDISIADNRSAEIWKKKGQDVVSKFQGEGVTGEPWGFRLGRLGNGRLGESPEILLKLAQPTDWPPNFGSVLEGFHGTPAIWGKSRLVNYYSISPAKIHLKGLKMPTWNYVEFSGGRFGSRICLGWKTHQKMVCLLDDFCMIFRGVETHHHTGIRLTPCGGDVSSDAFLCNGYTPEVENSEWKPLKNDRANG